jgi:hypothetical protein
MTESIKNNENHIICGSKAVDFICCVSAVKGRCDNGIVVGPKI